MMAQRSAIPDHLYFHSTHDSDSDSVFSRSTAFSGIGATFGVVAEKVGRGAICFVEKAIAMSKLRAHRDTLKNGKGRKLISQALLKEMISELVEFSL